MTDDRPAKPPRKRPSRAKAQPARRGARLKLNQHVLDELLRCISTGVTQDVAARTIGVTPRTLKRWLAEGRAAADAIETGDPDFTPDADDHMRIRAAEAIDQARYRCEVALAANIVAASRGGQLIGEFTRTLRGGGTEVEKRYTPPDWRAAAFILERTRRERWARQIAVTDPDGRPFGAGVADDKRRYDMASELSELMKQGSPANQN